jgi:hypothetical protein
MQDKEEVSQFERFGIRVVLKFSGEYQFRFVWWFSMDCHSCRIYFTFTERMTM